MARSRTVLEDRRIAGYARMGRTAAALATGSRQNEQAEAHINAMRAEAVKAIVDVAPLLTAEQREQLRPILVGSIPAQADTLPAA
jgi:hypothetical protein